MEKDMGISPDYCRRNADWAAARIDELERQIEQKFFAPTPEHGPKLGATDGWQKDRTGDEVQQALEFADALDYSHGWTRWVDTIKTLAWAVRSNAEVSGLSTRPPGYRAGTEPGKK